MIISEKEKLYSMSQKYISIAITEEGKCYNSTPIIWLSAVSAYNMKTPDVYLSYEDIYDSEIMSKLQENHVVGCYVYCALSDYNWLENFPQIQDLFIMKGENFNNISLLEKMQDLFMLFLQDVHLKDLGNIFLNTSEQQNTHSYCLGLHNCIVDDISEFCKSDLTLRELLVYNPKTRNEKKKWQQVKTERYKYYEI